MNECSGTYQNAILSRKVEEYRFFKVQPLSQTILGEPMLAHRPYKKNENAGSVSNSFVILEKEFPKIPVRITAPVSCRKRGNYFRRSEKCSHTQGRGISKYAKYSVLIE